MSRENFPDEMCMWQWHFDFYLHCWYIYEKSFNGNVPFANKKKTASGGKKQQGTYQKISKIYAWFHWNNLQKKVATSKQARTQWQSVDESRCSMTNKRNQHTEHRKHHNILPNEAPHFMFDVFLPLTISLSLSHFRLHFSLVLHAYDACHVGKSKWLCSVYL